MSAGPIPVREYASADEMRRHAQEVRERLFAPRSAPMAPRRRPAWSRPLVVERGIVSAKQARGEAGYGLADCIRIAAVACGLTLEELRGPGRFRRFSKGRQISYWLARRYAKSTTWEIGKFYGFDHTTVTHGCQRVDGAIARCSIGICGDPRSDAAALWRAKWPALSAGRA